MAQVKLLVCAAAAVRAHLTLPELTDPRSGSDIFEVVFRRADKVAHAGWQQH